MRTREFTMQDLYSFDTGQETAEVSYALIREAYEQTLIDLRLPFVVKEQTDMGSIGGVKSHEFHVLSDSGEDTYFEPTSGYEAKSIEVAHIFMLGDQYTKPIKACYVDRDGHNKAVFMCSFGLGIERTVAAYLEHYLDDGRDLLWSWSLAPFKVMILGAEHPEAVDLYVRLNAAGYDAMIDDRTGIPFKQQLKEGMMMGLPIYIILGKRFDSEEKVEVKSPLLGTTTYLDLDGVVPHLEELRSEIRDVELVQMSFDILRVDRDSKKIYVKLKEPSQLENSYCRRVERGTDLLGNFGNRKQPNGYMFLKAGQYWIVPVMQLQGSETQVRTYKNVPYVLTSQFADASLDEMTAVLR